MSAPHLQFARPTRPSADFSDIRLWSRLRRTWPQISQHARPDPVQRLAQEVQHYQSAELPLEQVTALRQIRHLLPLAERDLLRELEYEPPRLKREEAAQAVELILLACSLLDPENSAASRSSSPRPGIRLAEAPPLSGRRPA
jgi:hypothetical protein